MRPERLELEGFTTFRDPTEIDFTGVELFALTGATGAGKSSVVDAVCFALYGVVPRLDDQRLIAPVISQGRLEAKVRLDFSVDGQRYQAVRVVRATKSGASTKEAALIRVADGEVLASNADELTSTVEELLGLSFGHFTTCVVLPQGEFARFLHAKPRDRQELLIELLDLGLFGRMRELARSRENAAEARRDVIAAELGTLDFATSENRAAVSGRVERFEKLLAHVDDLQPRLDALAEVAATAGREIDGTQADLARLAAVEVPSGLADLAESINEAREALGVARITDDATASAVTEAEAALGALMPRAELEALGRIHDEHDTLLARREKGEEVVTAKRAAGDSASAAHKQAEVALQEASAAVEDARRIDRAHEFVTALVTGEPCPICRQEVHALPQTVDDAALGEAETLARAAQVVFDEADQAARVTTSERERAEALLDQVKGQLVEIEARLSRQVGRTEIESGLAAIVQVETQLDAARKAAASAHSVARRSQEMLDGLARREVDARTELVAVRDTVSTLDPPIPGTVDLRTDWEMLVAWSVECRPRLERKIGEAKARAKEAGEEQERLVTELLDLCRAAGLDPGPQPGRDVSQALQSARLDLESIDNAIERATNLRADDERVEAERMLAEALVRHLNANKFEKWVLDESLRQLVERATGILFDLSGGLYALTLDPRTSNFAVVDHANADAVRSARTLSGGETFLASLALALGLADQVAQHAAGGAARLESIFLDEGFGTLDSDALEAVAGAIEELGAQGRMVGLISHVAELAERLPTRFEVVKGSAGSTVTRVDA